MWKIREPQTIKELFALIHDRIEALASGGVDVSLETAGRDHAAARCRQFGAELGMPMDLCHLPGCRAPFIKRPVNREFCSVEHQILFNNKYNR